MRRKLDGKICSIYPGVTKEGKTFEDFAEKYQMTISEFEAGLKERVTPKKFREMKNASERNKANRESSETRAEKIRKTTTKQQKEQEDKKMARKSATTATAATATKKEMETKKQVKAPITERERLEKEKAEVKRKLTLAETEAEANGAILLANQQQIGEAQATVIEIKKALENAQELLTKAQKACEDQANIVKSLNDQVEKLKSTISDIDGKILEIDKKVIYLVAPGYTGKLPTVGKLISCVQGEGLTVETGTAKLVKEPMLSDLANSGFEKIQEVLDAYNFARLVVKYKVEQASKEDVKILLDDERIQKILVDQGIEL